MAITPNSFFREQEEPQYEDFYGYTAPAESAQPAIPAAPTYSDEQVAQAIQESMAQGFSLEDTLFGAQQKYGISPEQFYKSQNLFAPSTTDTQDVFSSLESAGLQETPSGIPTAPIDYSKPTNSITTAATNTAPGVDDWMTFAGGQYQGDVFVPEQETFAMLPPGFNWQEYIRANPDLAAAGIDTETEAKRHYTKYGRFEPRQGAGQGFDSFQSALSYAIQNNITTPQAIGQYNIMPLSERSIGMATASQYDLPADYVNSLSDKTTGYEVTGQKGKTDKGVDYELTSTHDATGALTGYFINYKTGSDSGTVVVYDAKGNPISSQGYDHSEWWRTPVALGLTFVGATFGAPELGALLGAGAGTTSAALLGGAVLGGAGAAVSGAEGTDILKGAALGAAGAGAGQLGGQLGSAAAEAIGGEAGKIVGGAVKGGISALPSAIATGDVKQLGIGALAGGVGAGASSALSDIGLTPTQAQGALTIATQLASGNPNTNALITAAGQLADSPNAAVAAKAGVMLNLARQGAPMSALLAAGMDLAKTVDANIKAEERALITPTRRQEKPQDFSSAGDLNAAAMKAYNEGAGPTFTFQGKQYNTPDAIDIATAQATGLPITQMGIPEIKIVEADYSNLPSLSEAAMQAYREGKGDTFLYNGQEYRTPDAIDIATGKATGLPIFQMGIPEVKIDYGTGAGRGRAAGPTAAELASITAPARGAAAPTSGVYTEPEQLDYETLLTGMQTGAPVDRMTTPTVGSPFLESVRKVIPATGEYLGSQLESAALRLGQMGFGAQGPEAVFSPRAIEERLEAPAAGAARQSEIFKEQQRVLAPLSQSERNAVLGLSSGLSSATGYVFGGIPGAITMAVGNTANQTWQDGLERGLSTEQNATRTAVQSGIELVGELAGIPFLKSVMRGLPAGAGPQQIGAWVADKAKGVLGEEATEVVTAIAQNIADKISALGGVDKTPVTLDETLKLAGDTAVQTLYSIAAQGGAGAAGRAAVNLANNALNTLGSGSQAAATPDVSELTFLGRSQPSVMTFEGMPTQIGYTAQPIGPELVTPEMLTGPRPLLEGPVTGGPVTPTGPSRPGAPSDLSNVSPDMVAFIDEGGNFVTYRDLGINETAIARARQETPEVRETAVQERVVDPLQTILETGTANIVPFTQTTAPQTVNANVVVTVDENGKPITVGQMLGLPTSQQNANISLNTPIFTTADGQVITVADVVGTPTAETRVATQPATQTSTAVTVPSAVTTTTATPSTTTEPSTSTVTSTPSATSTPTATATPTATSTATTVPSATTTATPTVTTTPATTTTVAPTDTEPEKPVVKVPTTPATTTVTPTTTTTAPTTTTTTTTPPATTTTPKVTPRVVAPAGGGPRRVVRRPEEEPVQRLPDLPLFEAFYYQAMKYGPQGRLQAMADPTDFQGRMARTRDAMELAIEGAATENEAEDAVERVIALANENPEMTVEGLIDLIGRG